MSHYFIEDSNLKDDIKTFNYYYGSEKFIFSSNSGMFSHGHVDPASDILIKTLPKLSGSFLDLGCGYGVIGIVLAKVNTLSQKLTLTMADINGITLDFAKKNCYENEIKAEFIKSDCFDEIEGMFNHISLNPPIHAGKTVINKMYEQSYNHLMTGGSFYIIIQEKHGASSSIKKLTSIYGNCDILYKKKGYFLLKCTK